MANNKNSFRHDSLQDKETIQDLLKAITKGIGKGKITFSDDTGEIVMQPEGLLDLKITARQDDSKHRLNIRITWQTEEKKSSKKLRVE